MIFLNKSKGKKIIIVALVVAFIILGYLWQKDEKEYVNNENNPENTEVITSRFVIYIKGEVKNPGLYLIDKDKRINDAINLAGGFTDNANTKDINLAEKITDGMTITISSRAVDEYQSRISINKANLEELQKLPRIGPALAQRIIDYRNKNDGFKTIEEIMNISGISEAIFEQIKDDICL